MYGHVWSHICPVSCCVALFASQGYLTFQNSKIQHNTFCSTRLLCPWRFIDIFWTKKIISNKLSLFPFPLWWIPHTNQNDISVLQACRQNNLTTGNESDRLVYLPPATCFGLTWDKLVLIWQNKLNKKNCKRRLKSKDVGLLRKI